MNAEPTALQMVQQLHEAVYGGSWARPLSPEQVWSELLERVRSMAAGACARCQESDRRWSEEPFMRLAVDEPFMLAAERCFFCGGYQHHDGCSWVEARKALNLSTGEGDQ